MPRKHSKPAKTVAAWAQDDLDPAQVNRANVYRDCSVDSPRSFRLLRLKGATISDSTSSAVPPALQAELETHLLDDAPPYAALSYSWAKLENKTVFKDLHVGKRGVLPISTHLTAALQRLRKEGVLHVWIDAICIDQSSVEDRNAQVRVMFDIYSRAHTVYVWLAQTPITEHRALVNAATDGDPILSEASEASHMWFRSMSLESRERSNWVGLPVQWIQSLFEWGDKAWWRRKWIVQEIASSPSEPILLYADHAFYLSDFLGGFRDIAVKLREQAASGNEYLGSKLGRNLTYDDVAAVMAPGDLRERLKSAAGQTIHWIDILEMTRPSRVTQLRDHIYSIRGLVATQEQEAVHVDYDRPIPELYNQVSHLVWQQATFEAKPTQDMDALCSFWGRLELPSWAHDFSMDREGSMARFRSCWATDFAQSQTASSRQMWGRHYIESPVTSGQQVALDRFRPKANLDQTTISVFGIILGRVLQVTAPTEWEYHDFRADFAKYLGVETSTVEELGLYRGDVTFNLDTGHVGIGLTSRGNFQEPSEPEVGDIIVNLLGSSMATILRPRPGELSGSAEGQYLLRGPCWLSNGHCRCHAGFRHQFTEGEERNPRGMCSNIKFDPSCCVELRSTAWPRSDIR